MNAALKVSVRKSSTKRLWEAMPKLDNGEFNYDLAADTLEKMLDLAVVVYGKKTPNIPKLEQTILGGCMIDQDAFLIAQEGLVVSETPFYSDAHNAIWEAMHRLITKNAPIDLLTVTEELRYAGQLETIGGAYYLVELTNMISSNANIEYHCRLVYQSYLRRRVISVCSKAVKESYQDMEDIFDIIQNMSTQFNELENPRASLKALTMSDVMLRAKNAEPNLDLCGSIIKINEVSFIFSVPGSGKTIFSIQAADAISKGHSLFHGILRNECPPLKIVYFDFELTFSNYKNRYIDAAGNAYQFSENFIRVGNDEDNPSTMAEFMKNYEYIISRHIDKHKPEVVFIDNLTAISGGMLADAIVATKIMNTLLMLKYRYKLTVVIIAHCPKSNNSTLPITSGNMSGSSVIMAYADSITAIGMSAMDKSIRYMKQTKTRTGEMVFDEDNVIQLAINKEGAFLQLKTLEEPFGREKEHLTDFNQIDETDVIEECIQYMNINNKSLRDTVKEKRLPFSHTALGNKIKKYKSGSVQNEFNHSEPVKLSDMMKVLEEMKGEPMPF